MTDILALILPQFKEATMQYGLWETVFAYSLMGIAFIFTWQLPKILEVIKNWRNKQ